MKKSLLIIVGVVLILIVGGVWALLFVFGTPEEGEGIFANFRSGGNAPIVTGPNPSIVDTSPVDQSGTPQRLKQLTTRPVAGAVFIEGGIRYVEKGTGHIYDIMFSTGNETRMSSLTVPQVVEAQFSVKGDNVALISQTGSTEETFIGTLSPEVGLVGLGLPTDVREVVFDTTSNNIVFFLEETLNGSVGRAYNMESESSSVVFESSLRDIEVLWGDEIYIYTTPTAFQTGYFYKVVGNGGLEQLDFGKSLTGFVYDEGYVISREKNGLVSATANENGVQSLIAFQSLPEKCTTSNRATSSIYCAEPLEIPQGDYPDDWYKGITSFSDTLWHSEINTGESEFLVDLKAESGREIDVVNIKNSSDGNLIHFINKNDNSLWMFDTTL